MREHGSGATGCARKASEESLAKRETSSERAPKLSASNLSFPCLLIGCTCRIVSDIISRLTASCHDRSTARMNRITGFVNGGKGSFRLKCHDRGRIRQEHSVDLSDGRHEAKT